MDLFEIFKTIAQIDSVSGEENEVANYIVQFLTNLDLEPAVDANGMIYCRVGSGYNPVLFCAHMDTVEPGRNIVVIQKDGYITSAGNTICGGDNKISLAAMLYSVQQIITSGQQCNIELLFTVREETNSGVQDFDTNILESKYGFIFDGGGGDLGWLASKASTIQDFVIELHGVSSHASAPEAGKNVLQVLMNLGSNLTLGRPDEQTTFNIGIIQGGSATNTIPGYLRLEGDLRCRDTNLFNYHKKNIEVQIDKVAQQYGVRAEFTWIPYAYGYELNTSDSVYNRLATLYQNYGIVLCPVATTSGSDAGFLNNQGITTYCLGDGVVGAHTVDERIAIDDFATLQQIVQELMVSIFP